MDKKPVGEIIDDRRRKARRREAIAVEFVGLMSERRYAEALALAEAHGDQSRAEQARKAMNGG